MNLKDPKLTALQFDDLLAEWCIYEDTDENRKKFSL